MMKPGAEYRAALAIAESLRRNGEDKLRGKEDTLLDLLAGLAEHMKSDRSPAVEPVYALRLLMQERGLDARDLAAARGSRSRLAGILSRKLGISRDAAKRLAGLLSAPHPTM